MTHPTQHQETLRDDQSVDAHGIVSRKSSRETGVYARGLTAEDGEDDEARFPQSRAVSTPSIKGIGAMIRGSLDGSTGPSGAGTTTTSEYRPSSSSLSSDPQGSTPSFFLTLKPAKPPGPDQHEEHPHAASHDRVDHTTTDAEDDRRLHTPAKRSDAGATQETPRSSSGRKPRERKAHAPPPPRNARPAFMNLVLPHAPVPRAPSSGSSHSFATDIPPLIRPHCDRHVLLQTPVPRNATAKGTACAYGDAGRE